jgi:hypothetical protein
MLDIEIVRIIQDKNNECRFIDNQYYNGFLDECVAAGNTREICKCT